jgi:hypothetical protein
MKPWKPELRLKSGECLKQKFVKQRIGMENKRTVIALK